MCLISENPFSCNAICFSFVKEKQTENGLTSLKAKQFTKLVLLHAIPLNSQPYEKFESNPTFSALFPEFIQHILYKYCPRSKRISAQ